MKMSLQFESGDTLFTFTDGVVEGSRGLRKLVTGLTTNKTLRTGKEFFDFSVECGKQYVQRDDRTMLFIRFS
jgi:serine phosphatase RsbU (regulator of sigma subunit)